MRVSVKEAPAFGSGSSSVPLALEMEGADTVAILKGRVRDRLGVPETGQRLLYSWKQLEDARQLSDYNMADGAEVVLVRRLPARSATKLASMYGTRGLRPRTAETPGTGY